MKVLFLGDIVGRNGLDAVKKYIHKIVSEYSIDFVIANGENASNGKGLLLSDYKELVSYGIDAITLGNHYLNKIQIEKYIDDAEKLVRPLNIRNNFGGVGTKIFTKNSIKVRVTNVLGEAFMNESVDEPYSRIIQELLNESKCIHVVDFHAESTSEKQILGLILDGQVSAVIGTHTHVQTNDARILPKGTGFMCDVGMCGQYNGVIGFEKNSVINKIMYGKTDKFTIDVNDISQINGVIMDFDEKTYMCKDIRSIKIIEGAK